MRKHFLAVLAYVVATFATQAVSHFGVNAAHYAAVTYLRAQPIFALGVLSMLIQGSIMSYLYAQLPQSGRSIGHAVLFAWLVGSILVSYEALAEAAKYGVPSVASWIARSEEHTSELQSPCNLVCRLLLEKKKNTNDRIY